MGLVASAVQGEDEGGPAHLATLGVDTEENRGCSGVEAGVLGRVPLPGLREEGLGSWTLGLKEKDLGVWTPGCGGGGGWGLDSRV